eukprot:4694462-Prymnesium_polylepis.1
MELGAMSCRVATVNYRTWVDLLAGSLGRQHIAILELGDMSAQEVTRTAPQALIDEQDGERVQESGVEHHAAAPDAPPPAAQSAPAPATHYVEIRGARCALHEFTTTASPGAVALVFHGFGAHGRFPTVRYAAELLAGMGMAVYAMDLPGHGESEGMRGFLGGADEVLSDAAVAVAEARRRWPALPLFLVGSSLG